MLLAIDAGNSYIKLALFDGDQIRHHFLVANRADLTVDDLATATASGRSTFGLTPDIVDAAVIGSVVPSVTSTLVSFVRDRLQADVHVPKYSTDLGIKVDYDRPTSLGIDRLADAIAAADLYGTPSIAVDMGTATTFNVVMPGPTFAGGVIGPGVGVLSETLASRTAQLHEVSIAQPDSVVANSTKQALQSGLYYGYASMVDGIVARIQAELEIEGCPVIAAGGASSIVAEACRWITVVDGELTLQGLRLMYERRANGIHSNGP